MCEITSSEKLRIVISSNFLRIENIFWEIKPPFLPERIIFKSPHLIDEFIFFVLNLYAYFSRYPSNRDVHRHFFFSNVSLYNGLFKPSFILKVLLLRSDFLYIIANLEMAKNTNLNMWPRYFKLRKKFPFTKEYFLPFQVLPR